MNAGTLLLRFVLVLAFLSTISPLVVDLAGRRWRIGLGNWRYVSSWLLAGTQLVLFLIWIFSFVGNDFSLAEVGRYSSAEMPWYYRLSASWAGDAGAFVLLATISSTATVSFFRLVLRKKSLAWEAASFAVLLVIVLVEIELDPFAAGPAGATGGIGLDPVLRTPLMALHPVLTFGAYSTAAILGARGISALWDRGAGGGPWARYPLGRAVMLARITFLLLTASMALGALWAYDSLGWGGFWAWDPVETSMLCAWLFSLVCLHAFTGARSQERLFLLAGSCCIVLSSVFFSMFITRSGGLIFSVHGYPASSETVLGLIGDSPSARWTVLPRPRVPGGRPRRRDHGPAKPRCPRPPGHGQGQGAHAGRLPVARRGARRCRPPGEELQHIHFRSELPGKGRDPDAGTGGRHRLVEAGIQAEEPRQPRPRARHRPGRPGVAFHLRVPCLSLRRPAFPRRASPAPARIAVRRNAVAHARLRRVHPRGLLRHALGGLGSWLVHAGYCTLVVGYCASVLFATSMVVPLDFTGNHHVSGEMETWLAGSDDGVLDVGIERVHGDNSFDRWVATVGTRGVEGSDATETITWRHSDAWGDISISPVTMPDGRQAILIVERPFVWLVWAGFGFIIAGILLQDLLRSPLQSPPCRPRATPAPQGIFHVPDGHPGKVPRVPCVLRSAFQKY